MFALTSWPERVKSVVVALPFLALVVDFGSRFLARYIPGIVYLMMVSGATIGLMIAVMIAVPLYEMWLRKAPAH